MACIVRTDIDKNSIYYEPGLITLSIKNIIKDLIYYFEIIIIIIN